MHYSPEALTAFVEAAASGSFSAAARRMRKTPVHHQYRDFES